jgi:hypothetical protein
VSPTPTHPSYSLGWLRVPSLLYLLGLLNVYLGERLVGGDSATRQVLDGLGLLLIATAFGLAGHSWSRAPAEQKPAYFYPLIWMGLGLLGLISYALGTDTALELLKLTDDETEHRVQVLTQAGTALLLLLGLLPLLMAENALAASPLKVVPMQVREAGWSGLSLALGLAALFPINYVAADMNKRWDFGYFKTARPGSSTIALVEGLDEPVRAILFFPNSSNVSDELRTYFNELPPGQMGVEWVDHALEPELAKELKIRDNGYIALVRGEGESQQVEKINIGTDFDSAKRKLKKLDEDFRTALLKIAAGKKTVYFTVGHGELYWTGTDLPAERKVSTLKKIFESLNYKVKELGLTQGLATAVPDDAALVIVLGPSSDFLPEELATLEAYRKAGGALLIGLEPGGYDMAGLLATMGLRFDKTVTLASEQNFLPATQKKSDRSIIFTNKFSTHESVTTMSRNSKVAYVITPGAGALEEIGGGVGKVTITTRSLPEAFGDLDGDLEFDAELEKRKSWSLAAAVSGPREGAALPEKKEGEKAEPKLDRADEFRAVVVADASWISDRALDPTRPNGAYFADTLAWLTQDPALSGTVNNEEDIKIEHTKEGQGWMFYGTALLVPLGLFGAGLSRVMIRRSRGGK